MSCPELGIQIVTRGDGDGEKLAKAIRSTLPLEPGVLGAIVDTRYGREAIDVIRSFERHFGYVRVREGVETYEPGDHINFAATRERADELLREAGAEWSLHVDSDEVIHDIGAFREFVNQSGSIQKQLKLAHPIDGIAVIVACESAIGEEVTKQIRCRRLNDCDVRWVFPIHNQPRGFKGITFSNLVLKTSYKGVLKGRIERALPALTQLWHEAHLESDEAWTRVSSAWGSPSREETKMHAAYFLGRTLLSIRAVEDASWVRDQGDYLGMAEAWLERCRKLDPFTFEYQSFWQLLSQVYLQQNRYDDAMNAITEGLRYWESADLCHQAVAVWLKRWFDATRAGVNIAIDTDQSRFYLNEIPEVVKRLHLPLIVHEEE